MKDAMARMGNSSTWLALPALLVAAIGLVFLAMSVQVLGAWVLGTSEPDHLTGLIVGAVGTVASMLIVGAYLDAFVAIVRSNRQVGTWIRVSCELVVTAPLVWIIFGVAALVRWGEGTRPVVGCLVCIALYLIGCGWVGIIRDRRRPTDSETGNA